MCNIELSISLLYNKLVALCNIESSIRNILYNSTLYYYLIYGLHIITCLYSGVIISQLITNYVNDLSNLKLSTGSSVVLYADDIRLHRSVASVGDFEALQNGLNKITKFKIGSVPIE